jgi:hypothetical protein
MSLSTETRLLHAQYERDTTITRTSVDEAFDAAVAILRAQGFDTAMDDRAETLAVAIYKYLLDSTEPDVYDPADNGNQGS